MDQNQMMLEYLTQVGTMKPQQDAIAQKRELVNRLRKGGAMPQMSQQGALRPASNPLEFLSSIAHTGVGEYQNQQANTAQDAYGAQRRAMLEALRQRMMPTTPEQPPAPELAL